MKPAGTAAARTAVCAGSTPATASRSSTHSQIEAATACPRGAASVLEATTRSASVSRSVAINRSSAATDSTVPNVPIHSPPGSVGLAHMLARASSVPPMNAAAAATRGFHPAPRGFPGALAAGEATGASRVTEETSLIAAS